MAAGSFRIVSLFIVLTRCCAFADEPPVMKSADLAAQAAVPADAPVPDLPPKSEGRESSPDTRRAIVPGPAGVIDATVIQDGDADPVLNPFRRRFRRPLPVRDVPLLISAALNSTRPADASAVINDKLYETGDTIEGLQITSIDDNVVEFTREGLVFRIPVDRPVVLRLPR
jgi:hypothetical protein